MPNISFNRMPVRVGSVYGFWKTYPKHASEMRQMEAKANAPVAHPEQPVVFSKPAASLIHSGECVKIPMVQGKPLGKNLQHEIELVLLVGKTAENVSTSEALTFISGYGLGLDMTLRDVQLEAKKNGLPWLMGKGFKTSIVVSDFIPIDTYPPDLLTLELHKNGQIAQKARTLEMEYSLNFLISYLSEIFILEPGDLIFTGTPSGTSQCFSGDKLEGYLYPNDETNAFKSPVNMLCQLTIDIA